MYGMADGLTGLDYPLLFEAITAVATLAVPIVVAVMAHRFNNQLKRWEASQWRNQELIKARLEYYRDLVPQLNDMMCFFAYVGGWKEMSPPAIVKAKRTLDRAFFCAAPLFDDDVQQAYKRFMDKCFVTYGGWGRDAVLKTGFKTRQHVVSDWQSSWETLFLPGEEIPQFPPPEVKEIIASYDSLIAAFARNIELSNPRDRYIHAWTATA
jgi:hypothetical protein